MKKVEEGGGGGGEARDLQHPAAHSPTDQQRPQRPFSIYKLLIFRKPNCECLGLGQEQAATLAEGQAEAEAEAETEAETEAAFRKISQGAKLSFSY